MTLHQLYTKYPWQQPYPATDHPADDSRFRRTHATCGPQRRL